jgi:hypothetical protein
VHPPTAPPRVKIEDLRLYYCESPQIAGDSVLRYELNDRIRGARRRNLLIHGLSDRSSLNRGAQQLVAVGMFQQALSPVNTSFNWIF